MDPVSTTTRPIAYLATAIPSLSETFVYREIRKLRDLGWPVTVASLYPYDAALEKDFSDLTTGSITINQAKNIPLLLLECLLHPWSTLRTLLGAAKDALVPGEPMSTLQRAKLIFQALSGIYLAGRLRKAQVRHLHCHFAHAPTSVGMYAARQLGIPFSFTGHANDLFQRRALLRRKLERAAFVACISRWHRQFYTAIVPEEAERYQVVRCGIDVDAWTPRAVSPAADRPLRLLSVARLVEKKGIDTLVRAVAAAGREVEATIAGDGPERERLHALAQELGCSERVRFLGSVPNERVRQLMGETDAFVLPCRVDSQGDQDGIPVVLMEAMACGLPVICGDLPTIRELIDDDDSGRLVPSGDAGALSACFDGLTDEARARLSQNGRAKVDREFSLAVNIAILEKLIRH